MNWLNDQENEEKHVKSIALEAATQKIDQDSRDCSDSETLNMLTRKFGKFLKKNNKDKAQPSNRYNSKKPIDFNSSNYTCFGCGKQGHTKAKCLTTVSKEKKDDKKYEKKVKSRRAYNDDSSSISSSKDDEEANLCLMANEESESFKMDS